MAWYKLSALSQSWRIRQDGHIWPAKVGASTLSMWFRQGLPANIVAPIGPVLDSRWPSGHELWRQDVTAWEAGRWRPYVAYWACCLGSVGNMAYELLEGSQAYYTQAELRDPYGRAV